MKDSIAENAFEKGFSLSKEQKYDESKKQFLISASRNYKSDSSFMFIGIGHLLSYEDDSATKYLKKCLSIDSTNQEAKKMLNISLIGIGPTIKQQSEKYQKEKDENLKKELL